MSHLPNLESFFRRALGGRILAAAHGVHDSIRYNE